MPPFDLCLEAIAAGASFVARSFAGDKKQLVPLLKAALKHPGLSVLDIISPCVTFNDFPSSTKSWDWAKDHEEPLQEVGFVPRLPEIEVEQKEGETDPRAAPRRLLDRPPRPAARRAQGDRPRLGAAPPDREPGAQRVPHRPDLRRPQAPRLRRDAGDDRHARWPSCPTRRCGPRGRRSPRSWRRSRALSTSLRRSLRCRPWCRDCDRRSSRSQRPPAQLRSARIADHPLGRPRVELHDHVLPPVNRPHVQLARGTTRSCRCRPPAAASSRPPGSPAPCPRTSSHRSHAALYGRPECDQALDTPPSGTRTRHAGSTHAALGPPRQAAVATPPASWHRSGSAQLLGHPLAPLHHTVVLRPSAAGSRSRRCPGRSATRPTASAGRPRIPRDCHCRPARDSGRPQRSKQLRSSACTIPAGT